MTDPASAPPPPDTHSRPDRLPRLNLRSAAIGAAVVASVVYLLTMNRTIGFLDSGEVAAAGATLGIMHPTGYPTLTMLAYVVTAILPIREILALNILAAVLAGSGVGMLTLLFDRVIGATHSARASKVKSTTSSRSSKKQGQSRRTGRSRQSGGSKRSADAKRSAGSKQAIGSRQTANTIAADGVRLSDGSKQFANSEFAAAATTVATSEATGRSHGARALVAALAALFTAFTAIWWEQATGFEVYALQALLLPLVSVLFLRFVDRERARRAAAEPVRFTWDASLFALALGLAFTNHLMTIFLAPAFLVYYAWSLGLGLRSLKRLALLIPPFVAGLLPYLYLPIRSSMNPRFNWGRPDTWQRFIDHVSGKFAWTWMFSSEEVYRAQTAYFFDRLPSEVAYAGLAVAALGLVALFVRDARLGVWAALIFVACVGYAGGYRIYDIELYYPTAMLAVGIGIAAALGWILRRSAGAAIAVAAALAIANLALHFAGNDRSGNRLAEDFVHNVLVTAPKNAMVFSSNAAVFVTGSYYLQEVEGLRPDVIVINHDYLSNDWYVEELRHWQPELMRAVEPAVSRYWDLLRRANSGDTRAGLATTDAYDRMLEAFVEWQFARGGDAVVIGSLDRGFGASYRVVPWQLGYRLERDSGYVAQDFPDYRFSHWTRIDPFAANIYEIYGRQLAYRASYEAEHGHAELAERYRRYAMSFDPQYDVDNADELPLDAMSQVRATAEFYARLAASIPPR